MVEKRQELQKYFDDSKIVFGNDPRLIRSYISTGISELDIFLDGGLVRKGFSIFSGLEGQGKTWTAQQMARASLDLGLQVCYMDMEKAYDPKWWSTVGVNINKLWVAQPAYGEECIDMVCGLLEAETCDVIIIDSLAAMVPDAEADASAESNFYALQARMNSSFYRKATALNKSSHVFVIQQLRTKVGVVYGNPTTIPGGQAKDFYSSTSIQCKREGWIEENKVRKGFYLKYECMKQRGSANPGDYTVVPVLFTGRIDEIAQTISMAISCGFIVQEGSWYNIIDTTTGEKLGRVQGKAKLADLLMGDKNLLDKLIALLP